MSNPRPYLAADGIGIVTGPHDPIRFRQYDIWWDTVLAGPTTNTFGAQGNDFPGGYYHDVRGGMEHYLFYRGEVDWRSASIRVHHTIDEVVFGIFGEGLDPNLLETESRPRTVLPTRWSAVRSLMGWAVQFLPPVPSPQELPNYLEITEETFQDITTEGTSTTTVDGRTGHRMYVVGTSSAWSDDQVDHLELLAQSDVAWGLSLLGSERSPEQTAWLQHLIDLIGDFYDEKSSYFSNIFPLEGNRFEGGNVIVSRVDGRESTNVWYHTYNHARLAEIALANEVPWLSQLRIAVDRTMLLAERAHYSFPLFWWVDTGEALNNSDDPGSAGSFAWLMVRAYDLWKDDSYLFSAQRALRQLHRRKVDQVYGESTLLMRAAWAAHALADRLQDDSWIELRDDFVAAGLRMMYWSGPHVGMFQACAGIAYPALFENVGILLALDDFIDETPFPLRQILGLQLVGNVQFFDQLEPGRAVPYENLGTLEYPFHGEVGKEIYAAGEAMNLPYLQGRFLGRAARSATLRGRSSS